MVAHCRTTPGVFVILLSLVLFSALGQFASASSHQDLPIGLRKLHVRKPTEGQVINDGSIVEKLLQERGGIVSGVVCSPTQYLSVVFPTGCVECSKRDANATACNALGSTACSYGTPSSAGKCTGVTCAAPKFPSADGTSCLGCPANSTACDSLGKATGCTFGLLSNNGSCLAAPCPSGPSYLLPNGTACIDCQKLFGSLTIACNATSATSCSSGGSVNSTKGCSPAAPSCTSGTQFLATNGSACIDCKSAFGASTLTCTSAGALTCSAGNTVDSASGACKALSCGTGTFSNGTSCIDCKTRYGPLTLTCDANKALSCSAGVVNSTTGACVNLACTPLTSFLKSDGSACVDCKTAYGPLTATCDATAVITCLSGAMVNSTTGACSKITCGTGMFLGNNGTACINCNAIYGLTALTCDATKALSCSSGFVNSTTGVCTSISCTPGTSFANANGTACVDCKTAWGKNTLTCDSTHALTCSTGLVNGTTGQCSEVACPPLTSFLSSNGTACIDCKSAYGNTTLTCDATKALSCSPGGNLDSIAGVCRSLNCTIGTFLGMNGTACVDCAIAYGPATLTCTDKKALSCSRGLVNTTTGVCSDVVCPLLTSFANANATACTDCKTAWGNATLTCDATKALTCSSGLVDQLTGMCTQLNCTIPGTFLGNNGTACLPCVSVYGATALTCNEKTALNCSRAAVNATTGTCQDVTCSSPGTFVNANGTACADCKALWGPNTASCNAITALNCTTGAVNATGGCSDAAICATGTYLSVTNTTCLPCPNGLGACSVFQRALSQGGTIRCIGADEISCGLHVECPPGIPVGPNGECVSGSMYGHYSQTQQINYNADSDFYGAWSLGLIDGFGRLPHIPVIEQAPYYTFEGSNGPQKYGDLTITAGFVLHSGGATLGAFDGQGVFEHSAMAFGTCKQPFAGLKLESPGPCLDIILSYQPAGCYIYSPGANGFVSCPSSIV